MKHAIQIYNLVKTFPGVRALDDVSFCVMAGEIFGLLGPNGAGKTTTLSILQGQYPFDAGQVQVLGMRLPDQARNIKARIGVQLQSTSLFPDLTALEQVMLFGRLYSRQISRGAALTLLAQVSLEEKAGALPRQMSGGQHQRLALALALTNDPEIVFLDEPTAGFDPQARQALWQIVRNLRNRGRTVVLTTHYMDEAEELCDRVGIIDQGHLLSLDTPAALVASHLRGAIVRTGAALPIRVLPTLPGVLDVQRSNGLLHIQTDDVAATSAALFGLAGQLQLHISDLHVQQPGLEEVFLKLTGHRLREA